MGPHSNRCKSDVLAVNCSTKADGVPQDWHVLDDGPETGTNSGTQRGISRVPPTLWKDFHDRLFVSQKLSGFIEHEADTFLVTEHNVEHVAEAFHRVIVGAEAGA